VFEDRTRRRCDLHNEEGCASASSSAGAYCFITIFAVALGVLVVRGLITFAPMI
jgi:hypothetical protein